MGVRVHVAGLDRHASASLVRRVMNGLHDVEQSWWVHPTTNGTLLGLSDTSGVLEVLAQLAHRLEAEGFAGSVVGSRNSWIDLETQAGAARPVSCSAALAFTMAVPYEDGPLNRYGVHEHHWGVAGDTTRE